jgi:hypothetical protein
MMSRIVIATLQHRYFNLNFMYLLYNAVTFSDSKRRTTGLLIWKEVVVANSNHILYYMSGNKLPKELQTTIWS